MKLAKRSVVMLVFALLCMLQVATAQSTKLEAPYSHPLNLVMQDIMNYVSYGLTVVLLLAAARLGARQRTPFYVLIVLASMVAAFGEPIYDVCMMLWFYAPGMVSLFTAFGIPQPIWAHSGYAVLYAFPALCICNQIYKGTMTRSKLFAWAGAELFMSCVFEMLGINFGTYCYWGPHVFRIFNYPIIIAILEAAQTICFSVAAANLRQRVHSSSGLLALFVLFPLTMIGINGGGRYDKRFQVLPGRVGKYNSSGPRLHIQLR